MGTPISRFFRAVCVATVVFSAATASADEPVPSPAMPPVERPEPSPPPAPMAPRATGQGVAVINAGAPRDEVGNVARAVYASKLRPTALDEPRARVLAGDPPAADAVRDVRDLSELRTAIHGEDAASRKLLAGIAQQIGVQALLVVATEGGPTPAPTDDAGAPPAPAGPVVLRLFLAETGDFDAARYGAEPGATGPDAWRATVASLERRFIVSAGPPAATRPITPVRQEGETRPFYTSPWFWGAIGAALLVGGGFYLASRDTSDQPIHLQMHLP